MAQTTNRFLDDISRLVTDAAGAAQGVRREVETAVKGQIERMLKEMDVATREDVEVLRDTVNAARDENDALRARIAALEAKLGAAGPGSSASAAKAQSGTPGFEGTPTPGTSV